MTIYWSVMPFQRVMEGYGSTDVAFQEIEREGATMLVCPASDGMGRIERVISPRPSDYLRPDWQPGQLISMQGK